jgi:hypothetical protein
MIYLFIIPILFGIAHILAYVKKPFGFTSDLDKGEEFTKLGFLYWFNSYTDGMFSILTINRYFSIQFLAVYSTMFWWTKLIKDKEFIRTNFALFQIEVNCDNTYITICNIVLAFHYTNYDK